MSESTNDRTSTNRVCRTVAEGARLLPDQVRDLPALVVRTAVIGLSKFLHVVDKVRSGYTELQHGIATTPEPVRRALAVLPGVGPGDGDTDQDAWAPATRTAATTTAGAQRSSPGASVPETSAAEAPKIAEPPETAGSPETAESREAPTEPEQLPVPNYDELSLPSLRARLRNLTISDVGTLLAYERNHQNRNDVVTMYENRILKLQRQGA